MHLSQTKHWQIRDTTCDLGTQDIRHAEQRKHSQKAEPKTPQELVINFVSVWVLAATTMVTLWCQGNGHLPTKEKRLLSLK